MNAELQNIKAIIDKEAKRQCNNIELIASENFVSQDVLDALGSCLTNKYAEGYPASQGFGQKGRYYGGCQYMDEIENKCRNLWQQVFNTDYHVNVQPHSGTNANLEAYGALLNPGDTILSMSLADGGHLSHGHKINFSGKLYHFIHYGLKTDGYIDYEQIENLCIEYPDIKMIVAGASAYSREIDFKTISQICKKYNKLFMVDMAHIAGLIAAGIHQSPFGLADIITTTTHKTLRGPRGGLIFCKPEYAAKVDRAVFPGMQGGPLMNVIAAKAVCAAEALTSDYKSYIKRVVINSMVMANTFKDLGYNIVSNGTDNHLFLIDFSKSHPNITGLQVQELLDKYNITVNKNCVPNETHSAKETSGIRIGTAAMTTKGWFPKDFINCTYRIDELIKSICNSL